MITGSDVLGLGYGHSSWNSFTAQLQLSTASTGGVVQTAAALTDAALAFDALYVDQRWIAGRLAPGEISALIAFANTGKKVALLGENINWSRWNSDIISPWGGGISFEMVNGPQTPAVFHPLTQDIASVPVLGGGMAVGGTSLFGQNFATLWRPEMNVLTVLDSNVFVDVFGSGVFRRNIANWLVDGTAPVINIPEPSTYALLLCGLVLTLGAARRRRTAQATAPGAGSA